MTQLAITTLIKTLIDGMQVSGQGMPPLTAYTVPPVITEAAPSPLAYIWVPRIVETRTAGPRANGIKRAEYSALIGLVWTSGNDINQFLAIQTGWSSLVEAVQVALRAAPSSTMLTDPATGDTSELVILGEDLTCENQPLYTSTAQAMLWWSTRITVGVVEMFRA